MGVGARAIIFYKLSYGYSRIQQEVECPTKKKKKTGFISRARRPGKHRENARARRRRRPRANWRRRNHRRRRGALRRI